MGGFATKVSGSLTLNTDSRHYVVERSEDQGIEDLRRLNHTESLEESWVFVKARDKAGNIKTFWYEVGNDEQAHNNSIDHRILLDIKKDLHQKHLTLDDWSFYHFHPLHGSVRSIQTETPSQPDVSTLFNLAEYAALHKLITPKFRLITDSGLWKWQMTKAVPLKGDKTNDQYVDETYSAVEEYDNVRRTSALNCFPNQPCELPDTMIQKFVDALTIPWSSISFDRFATP